MRMIRACFYLLMLLAIAGAPAFAQTYYSALPNAQIQFFDASGNPLNGGKLYAYQAGTLVAQDTYTDSTNAVANTNPVILDSAGRAAVYLASTNAYKLILKTSADVTVFTQDNVSDFGATLKRDLATSFTTKSLDGQLLASQYSGATAGAQISAAITAGASSGVSVSAFGLPGAQSWTSDFLTAVTKPVLLELGAGTTTVSANVTAPSNVTLRFTQGTILSINSAKTLTINGSIDAPMAQIFTGSGTVAFGGRVTEVYPQWWGAVGDGTTDDSAAFQAAINTGRRVRVVYTSGGYKITTPLTAVTGMTLVGDTGRPPTLTASVAGKHIIGGASLTNIAIEGIRFIGVNSSTTPADAVGGFAAAETGLVTLNASTDIRITNSEFGTFYNGITTEQSSRVWITNNYVHNWKAYGVLASKANRIQIDDNRIIGCDQSGAVTSYGIHATGDQAGGATLYANSISRNTIADVPSWDGIMSHDIDGLSIIGNDIRNVRQGIDVGFFASTNIIKHVRVIGNYVESTTTNTWGVTGAELGGIIVSGYDNSNLLTNSVIAANVVEGFFATAGMVSSGNSSNITVAYTSNMTVTGNVVAAAGSQVSNAGIFLVGRNNGITVTGNSLQGAMAGGGVRLASVLADTVAVTGNTIRQTTTSDVCILLSGTTAISKGFAYDSNATNCDAGAEFQFGSTSFVQAGAYRQGSTTYDPPNLTAAAKDSVTVTVTGAALGDLVTAVSFSLDTQGVIFKGDVTAANTVTVTLFNANSGAVNLASGTIRVHVKSANQ